ncbi:MAG TPA: prepilin-type N-terminal cleavage/methylation domain-containing protein [Candidatus Omnitrophota bacterium]|nr:type II secretion system protein [Candidatus Omnitrophota bacterium]HQO57571.1 prepilin-type N-terminal cleavage/methylation domain-containing protein [Candidatus Omnitrophota bacterium]
MRSRSKIKGFTLIEMLLVVALLSIVGIMIVRQFGDTEKEAKKVAAAHNKKTLQQTVLDYQSLYGVFPSKWHSGLAADDLSSVEGLSKEVAINMAATATDDAIVDRYTNGYQVLIPGANVQGLSLGQAEALHENSIHQLVKGGYMPVSNPSSTAGTVPVAENLVAWVLTGGVELYRGGSLEVTNYDADYNTLNRATLGTEVVTINGDPLSNSQYGTDEAVVLVACSKELYWSGVLKGDPDADGTGYFGGEFIKDSQISLTEPPRDPKTRDASAFPYYWAVFYISPSQVGQDAGYSAKLLGVLDGDLNPVQS